MSWYHLLYNELKGILSDKTILLTVIAGILFYSFLYPQPYLHQIPREQKIAIIDDDNSVTSRKLIRMVQATPQVDIVVNANSRADARDMLIRRQIRGFLQIPENFGRDILLRRSPPLVYAGDGSYFLVYGAIAEGITAAAEALDDSVGLHRVALAGKPMLSSGDSLSPVVLNAIPAFNPTTGYVTYVVPAVFVLIIHQTLLIAVALYGVSTREKKRRGENGYFQQAQPLQLLLIRLLAFFIIYIPIILYYFGDCFQYYGLPRLASIGQLVQFFVPFLLSATALGVILGQLLPRRELATFFVLLSSLPLVFSAGFVWPVSVIPFWINWLVQWVPATAAINAVLHLNQMGEDFFHAAAGIGQLWGLFLLYSIGAWWLLRRGR